MKNRAAIKLNIGVGVGGGRQDHTATDENAKRAPHLNKYIEQQFVRAYYKLMTINRQSPFAYT